MAACDITLPTKAGMTWVATRGPTACRRPRRRRPRPNTCTGERRNSWHTLPKNAQPSVMHMAMAVRMSMLPRDASEVSVKGSGRMKRATMGTVRRNVWLNDWSLFDERVLLASTMVQLSTMAKTVKPMPARPAAGREGEARVGHQQGQHEAQAGHGRDHRRGELAPRDVELAEVGGLAHVGVGQVVGHAPAQKRDVEQRRRAHQEVAPGGGELLDHQGVEQDGDGRGDARVEHDAGGLGAAVGDAPVQGEQRRPRPIATPHAPAATVWGVPASAAAPSSAAQPQVQAIEPATTGPRVRNSPWMCLSNEAPSSAQRATVPPKARPSAVSPSARQAVLP